MLSNLNAQICQASEAPRPLHEPTRYQRSEKDDMKKAIELLYEFKRSLDELHPQCTYIVEQMLQHRRPY